MSHPVPGVHIDSLLFDLSVSRRATGARALALAGLKPSQGSIEWRMIGWKMVRAFGVKNN